ncbi:MAG: hypothetical protein GY803_10045 [Chloroflexi bacterium]|nr:hypothetical protein [Chloroflexota bacterium]
MSNFSEEDMQRLTTLERLRIIDENSKSMVYVTDAFVSSKSDSFVNSETNATINAELDSILKAENNTTIHAKKDKTVRRVKGNGRDNSSDADEG